MPSEPGPIGRAPQPQCESLFADINSDVLRDDGVRAVDRRVIGFERQTGLIMRLERACAGRSIGTPKAGITTGIPSRCGQAK